MDVSSDLYNSPPPSALMGVLAGLALLTIAGITLWKSGSAGAQQKLKMILAAILSGATGATMLVTTAHLFVVQISPGDSLWRVSVVAVWAHFAVVLVLVGILITAIVKRTAIGVAGAVLLLAVALTTYADLGMYYTMFDDLWALGVTLGWVGTTVAAVAFAATVSAVKIKAYGRRQFQRGQVAGLDASQQPATLAATGS